MLNILGFSRDHSGSMGHLAEPARRDYNEQIATVKEAARKLLQPTIVSTVTIGVGRQAVVGREIVNKDVTALEPLSYYATEAGGTPMIESVFELIKIMKQAPGADDPETSLVVMVTTDGQETQARHRGPELARLIRELQATDRWTFVFRVPKNGGVRELQRLGLMISGVNVFEWELSAKGVAQSTAANVQAYQEFFTARTTGQKRTSRFYANMEDISVDEARKALVDVSNEVQFLDVTAKDAGSLIRPFVEAKLGEPMNRGGAFYQLVKLEPKVQANKRIAIRDKSTGTVFAGDAARTMLALPTVGTVRLAPDELGEWDVFIQSTSVNRKLDPNTKLMYWKGVGKAFQEGPSAR